LAQGRETQERRRLEQARAELEAELAEEEAEYQQRLAEREAAIAWARELLGRSDWRLLDTETTGLDSDAQIVQLAVVSPTGEILLTTLVKPSIPIPAEASAIHGITNEHVAAAPTFPEVYPQLVALLAGRDVVAYNAAFDRSMVHAARRRYGLPRLGVKSWQCAMQQYSVWCGEWSAFWEDYRFQALPGGNHAAAGDCLATLHVLRVMASTGTSCVL
jgi:DNA polymerase-3 subunit epsilon